MLAAVPRNKPDEPLPIRSLASVGRSASQTLKRGMMLIRPDSKMMKRADSKKEMVELQRADESAGEDRRTETAIEQFVKDFDASYEEVNGKHCKG